MELIDKSKVFVQYRDIAKPYEPVLDRKYTITHSDETADMYVFISENYAEDKITKMRDEVRVRWMKTERGYQLIGSVLVDGEGVEGNSTIRSQIFYREMPKALQALRQADRFLFERQPTLDRARVFIKFNSSNPMYNKSYDFGMIGKYTY